MWKRNLILRSRIKEFLKVNRHVFAAFFIPVFILTLVFAITGIYPFGQQQIAVIDMYHQYVPFLGELQYRLQGGGSLFYSWNSGGGCNFWCLLSYYGASPLNLILILFPQKLLMEGITVILLIKVGLTGSFMFIYLKNIRTCADGIVDMISGWHTVSFACMYALCSYVIGYYWCIMWLDAVMVLPLCVLGLSRLISEGRIAMYTISLAYIVFANYYISIMVCIFILVYYPVLYFITVRGEGVKTCVLTALKAAGCSLLGIAMSAVMLLPTYISMKNAYYFSSDMPEEWSFYEDALDVINQLLPDAHLTYLDGLPNLCCGFLVTMMLIIYFISRDIQIREKALNGVFLLLMFFSMNINKLDFIWHGMHFPNQLPFRFSFVVCFVITGMAYRVFKRIDGTDPKTIMKVIAGMAAYYVFAQKLLADKVDDVQIFFYYGLAFLAMYSVVLMLHRTGRIGSRSFAVLLTAVVCVELLATTWNGIELIGNSSRETYNENRSSITALAEYAGREGGSTESGGDGTFSRMEVDDPIIHNCPALYHYRGMGQFSSTLNADTTGLMEKIGFEGHPGSNRFNYVETCPVLNCITNTNYLIGKNKKIEDADFEFVKKSGNSRLYKSRYPLSIGYMLPESIRTWNPVSEDPFENLNGYIKAATDGQISNVFEDAGAGEVEDYGMASYYSGNNTLECTLNESEENGTVILTFKAKKSGKHYVYAAADSAERITIERQDNKKDTEVQSDCGSVLNIGDLKKGEEFRIRVEFEKDRDGRVRTHVCTLDGSAWDKAYGLISENLMTVTDAGDTFIRGTVDVTERGMLMTSVPYEDGWHLKVDGNSRTISELAGGSWISLPLDVGVHKIELSFRPPGIIAGLIITLLSAAALLFMCRFRRIGIIMHAREQSDELPYPEFPEEESDCSKE